MRNARFLARGAGLRGPDPMRNYVRLLVATIAWGALAFGAVYPWGYWPLLLACAGLGLWGIFETSAWADPRTRHIGLALSAVAAAMFLQVIAMPYEWLAEISPSVEKF